MDKKIEELASFLKKGSKIHIKKSQRGSFTSYCGGKVTNECIQRGKNSPDPKIRKKATFAANARTWKHDEGGTIDSSNTFNGIKTTNNRPYDSNLISYINDKLRDGGMSKTKRAAVLANIIEESGGNPFAKGPGGFYGLLQWSNGRYVPTRETDTFKELDNQINYILQTEGNSTDKKSWTHGGKGSGYNSLNDAIKAFNENNLENSTRGFTLGYVRPAGGLDSLVNRYNVAKQIYNNPKFYQKGGELIYTPFLQDEEISKDVYTPFIPEITSDYTPSFPVEPVRNYTPIEQAPERTEQKVKTPEFEIKQVTAPKDAVAVSKPSEKMTTNGKIYKSSEKQAFKADIYNTYIKALIKRGLDDITANKFAQRLTTQDILESTWGQSTLSQYYNFGGIKDFRKNSNAAVLSTIEYENGQEKTIKQPFRKFNSLEDYINYKIDLVDKNWNVFKDIPENYFSNITKGSRKYATDPKYAEKLNTLNKQIWN